MATKPRTQTSGIQVTAKDLGLINHIAFLLDMSGSMSGREKDVIAMFDAQMENLAKLTTENGQETRITVYVFDTTVECLCFDKDVLRLPKIADHYKPRGGTAMIDASMRAIEDLEQSYTLYGDHAFMLIELTDGEENSSRTSASTFRSRVDALPENWTVVALVPDEKCKRDAIRFGFSEGNVDTWDLNKGVKNSAGAKVTAVTTNFMKGRAAGVRGSKSVFVQVNTANLVTEKVTSALTELRTHEYKLLDVSPMQDKEEIRNFVLDSGNRFSTGCAFYQLTKQEEVQANKNMALRDRNSGKVYTGPTARTLRGFPAGTKCVVRKPDNSSKYDIFIQSNSVNRKLVGGTKVLYIK